MQRESKNPPIEFRPRISIHHKACPELWDVFNKIPEERRTTTVMAMLTRLATMDVHGGPVIADASQQSFEELGRASSSGNHAVPSGSDPIDDKLDMFELMGIYATRK